MGSKGALFHLLHWRRKLHLNIAVCTRFDVSGRFYGICIMHRHFRLPRKFLLLMLIPLILINGRMSAGCICLDGHFKLFCGGQSCCHENRNDCCHGSTNDPFANHSTSDDCCKESGSAGTGAVDACCSQCCASFIESDFRECIQNLKSTGSCHKLSLIPANLSEIVSLQIDDEISMLDPLFLCDRLRADEKTQRPRFFVFSPPRERLKLLNRLLI